MTVKYVTRNAFVYMRMNLEFSQYLDISYSLIEPFDAYIYLLL